MTLDAVSRDYRAAFLRYLPRRDEAALHCGYELGRGAVADGVSLLELVRIHHEVLLSVLQDSRPEELAEVATAASEFLVEALAVHEMAQRRFTVGQ
jgi:Phosphoserine phosphatase RsbU, N-terminal domain